MIGQRPSHEVNILSILVDDGQNSTSWNWSSGSYKSQPGMLYDGICAQYAKVRFGKQVISQIDRTEYMSADRYQVLYMICIPFCVYYMICSLHQHCPYLSFNSRTLPPWFHIPLEVYGTNIYDCKRCVHVHVFWSILLSTDVYAYRIINCHRMAKFQTAML